MVLREIRYAFGVKCTSEIAVRTYTLILHIAVFLTRAEDRVHSIPYGILSCHFFGMNGCRVLSSPLSFFPRHKYVVILNTETSLKNHCLPDTNSVQMIIKDVSLCPGVCMFSQIILCPSKVSVWNQYRVSVMQQSAHLIISFQTIHQHQNDKLRTHTQPTQLQPVAASAEAVCFTLINDRQ